MSGLSEALRNVTPEDLAANREMVRDLNRLLEERLAGGDPDVSAFLAQHGQFFPGARTLDDIIEQLADRMAAMQSLLQSMTPGQRAELQGMMDALLRDDRLRWDLAQLAASLDQLLPGGLGDRFRFSGNEPLGLEGALSQMANLQALEGLEAQLDNIESPGDLATVDREKLRQLAGDEAARDFDALDDLAHRLERAGYLERQGDRLELTPRGSRRIGQKVLDDLFGRLRRDAFGGHRLDRAGRGGEREETSKLYEFGDPFHLDLNRTLANALQREENRPGRRLSGAHQGRPGDRPPRDRAPGGGRPGDRRPRGGRAGGGSALRLSPSDFEVFRTEDTTRTSTVLLVDMSRSMLLRGCFVAAKKVAIALNTLIRTQFPRDHLSVIGFAYYAREIRPETLAELSWHGYEYGTNLQHGLMLARRILAREHGGNRANRGDHRRRADGALRGRPGRVLLPADPADDPGNVARGRPLYEGRHHDQHVHARALALAGRIRGARDAAQPRSGLLRHAGAPRRVRPRGLRLAPDAQGQLATSPSPAASPPCGRPAGRAGSPAGAFRSRPRWSQTLAAAGRANLRLARAGPLPPRPANLSFCRPETAIRVAARPDRRIGADSCVWRLGHGSGGGAVVRLTVAP